MAWPDEGINVYTWANKPLASAYTGRAFISDIGGGSIWISNGTRWYPENGRVVLYQLPTEYSGTVGGNGVEGVVGQYLMPAGVLQNTDILKIRISYFKSGANGTTCTHSLRMGTLGTPSDTFITACSTTAPGGATNINSCFEAGIVRVSSTQVKRLGGGWAGGYNGTGTQAAGTNVTVTNLDSNPVYLSYTTLISTLTGDTFNLIEYTIELISRP